MNIIIAGAGKVGFNLAKTLSIGHNVTVIDTNEEALHSIQESLDILPLRGDVEDYKTYEYFSDKEVDLFIAVTNIDNVNLISSMIVDSILNVKRKFVRLQKDIYDAEDIKKRFFIDKIIFPIKLSSKTVGSLLEYPKANNVKFFKYTDFKLFSFRVSAGADREILDSHEYTLVGIERNKKFFVPQEKHTAIKENDLIYFFGLRESIETLSTSIVLEDISFVEKCVVFGGADLGVSIAKAFIDAKKDVKLIEKDLDLCSLADEKLEGRATIINSKYGIHDVFEDEELGHADLFVAATNNDEYNIIKCLEAKDRGITKVVAINNEMDYYSLMHTLGIIVIRGPKISAYNTIMEEISSSGVVIQKSFCGALGTVFMRKVVYNSTLIDKQIKPLKLSNAKLFILREDRLFLIQEKIILQENDLVVGFSALLESAKVKQWIYEL